MAEALVKELGIEDLYGFMGVDSGATDKEVTKAYRKKALKCHPDKNPDDPVAAEMFQKLSKVYHILSDPAAKAAYDKWLKARDAAQRRHNELSAKRKKMKENLQSKESQDLFSRMEEEDAKEKMKIEIERLREQGLEMVRRQEELLRQQMASQQQEEAVGDEDMFPTVKVVWEKKGSVHYTKQLITDLFSKYGTLEHVGLSKKNSRAIIAFQSADDALHSLSEGGLAESPLTVSWFAGQKPSSQSTQCTASLEDNEARVFARLQAAQKHQHQPSPQPHHHELTGGSLEDNEAIVFAKMKLAKNRTSK